MWPLFGTYGCSKSSAASCLSFLILFGFFGFNMLVLEPHHCNFLPFLHIQMWFLAIFKSTKQGQSVQKSRKSQNRVYTLLCVPKSPWIRCEPQKNVLRMYYGCFDHFLTAVQSILMPKTRILTYFSCFLRILEGLNYWAAWAGAARVHKNPKKSKSPKISLNIPQFSYNDILKFLGSVPFS